MLTDLATDLVTALVTALVTDLVMALDMDLVSALVTDLVTALVTRMRRTKQRAHVLLGRHGDKALLGYLGRRRFSATSIKREAEA